MSAGGWVVLQATGLDLGPFEALGEEGEESEGGEDGDGLHSHAVCAFEARIERSEMCGEQVQAS